jgi:hypothetical protein
MHAPSPTPVDALLPATWLTAAEAASRSFPDYLIGHDTEARIADFTERMRAGLHAQREVVAMRRVMVLLIQQHGPIHITARQLAELPADSTLRVRVDDRGGIEIDLA